MKSGERSFSKKIAEACPNAMVDAQTVCVVPSSAILILGPQVSALDLRGTGLSLDEVASAESRLQNIETLWTSSKNGLAKAIFLSPKPRLRKLSIYDELLVHGADEALSAIAENTGVLSSFSFSDQSVGIPILRKLA